MIKHTREKQVKIVATGLALCMLAAPLSASAAESSVLMASGGVASVLETERTLEEYIQIAQDAQGASWGYTNIGVANVESGNLNVRAVSSTDGKLVGKLPKDAACEVVETVDDWEQGIPSDWTGSQNPSHGTGSYGSHCQYRWPECTSGAQYHQ